MTIEDQIDAAVLAAISSLNSAIFPSAQEIIALIRQCDMLPFRFDTADILNALVRLEAVEKIARPAVFYITNKGKS